MAQPKPQTQDPLYRDYCTRCLRAASVCFCKSLAPIAPSFRIVLLQHPKERKNSIGTARLTHLSISNSLLIAGTDFDHDPQVTALLADPKNHCVVLYPGPQSVDIGEHKEKFREEILGTKDLVVFVIDGTWAMAKGMMRRSQLLMALPQIRFTPVKPSQYIVRRQPKEMCLSTVEAVHHLIGVLDPTVGADRLIEIFNGIVQTQLRYTERKNLRELKRELERAQ